MKKLTLRILCIGWILFLSAGSFIFTDESCHGNSLTTFIFQIGNTEVLVNQTIWRMDVAPELTDHRTFIPLRFLAEKMGAVVSWKENPSQMGKALSQYNSLILRDIKKDCAAYELPHRICRNPSQCAIRANHSNHHS